MPEARTETATANIERWLEGVKTGPRLKAASSCFLVAHALSRRTNGNEFRKTGRLVTWQSIPTLAAATGLSERMVRYAARRLEAAGHLAVMIGRGPRQSNRYTLIEMRHSGAAITEANTGTRVPQLPEQMRHSGSLIAAPGFTECGTGVPPNSSITHSRTLPATADTDAGGPRRASSALGPLGTALRIRIGKANFEAWFEKGEAELVSQTADTVSIAVKSHFFAEQIRSRFEGDLEACSGALQIRFVVREAGPPIARAAP
jgi:hypothetical protein